MHWKVVEEGCWGDVVAFLPLSYSLMERQTRNGHSTTTNKDKESETHENYDDQETKDLPTAKKRGLIAVAKLI